MPTQYFWKNIYKSFIKLAHLKRNLLYELIRRVSGNVRDAHSKLSYLNYECFNRENEVYVYCGIPAYNLLWRNQLQKVLELHACSVFAK